MSRLVEEARQRAEQERAAVSDAVMEAEQRSECQVRAAVEAAAARRVAELEEEHGICRPCFALPCSAVWFPIRRDPAQCMYAALSCTAVLILSVTAAMKVRRKELPRAPPVGPLCPHRPCLTSASQLAMPALREERWHTELRHMRSVRCTQVGSGEWAVHDYTRLCLVPSRLIPALLLLFDHN